MIETAIATGWLLCGFVGYGLTVGHFQGEWLTVAAEDWYRDRIRAGFLAFNGPGLLITILLFGHPIRWKL